MFESVQWSKRGGEGGGGDDKSVFLSIKSLFSRGGRPFERGDSIWGGGGVGEEKEKDPPSIWRKASYMMLTSLNYLPFFAGLLSDELGVSLRENCKGSLSLSSAAQGFGAASMRANLTAKCMYGETFLYGLNSEQIHSNQVVHVCVEGSPRTGRLSASAPTTLPDMNHLVPTHSELNELPPLAPTLNHISLSDMGTPGQTHTPSFSICLSTKNK